MYVNCNEKLYSLCLLNVTSTSCFQKCCPAKYVTGRLLPGKIANLVSNWGKVSIFFIVNSPPLPESDSDFATTSGCFPRSSSTSYFQACQQALPSPSSPSILLQSKLSSYPHCPPIQIEGQSPEIPPSTYIPILSSFTTRTIEGAVAISAISPLQCIATRTQHNTPINTTQHRSTIKKEFKVLFARCSNS